MVSWALAPGKEKANTLTRSPCDSLIQQILLCVLDTTAKKTERYPSSDGGYTFVGTFYNVREGSNRKPDFTEHILGASQMQLHLNHTKASEKKHNVILNKEKQAGELGDFWSCKAASYQKQNSKQGRSNPIVSWFLPLRGLSPRAPQTCVQQGAFSPPPAISLQPFPRIGDTDNPFPMRLRGPLHELRCS